MKRQHIQQSFIAASALMMVITFQNCGKSVGFSSEPSGLVATLDTNTIGDGSGDGSEDGDVGVDLTPDPRPAPSPIADNDVDDDKAGGRSCGGKNPHSGVKDSDDVSDDRSDKALHYVCILDGPGQSVKVGYQEEHLVGQVSTPHNVCMSKHACLNILSAAFSVQGPAYRGFCKERSPQIMVLSDQQIADLVAAH